MTGADLLAGFGQALLDPALPVPCGLATWNGSDPAQRFGIYRNNVVVSLVDALSARFPVVGELTGVAFFRAMARLYVLEQPPRSRLMAEYGTSFPRFIDGFRPACALPYLGDVARLEAARTTACHAKDAPSLGAGAFAALDPASLGDVCITLHPSAAILTSRHAIFSVWAAHQGAVDIGTVDPSVPEDVLVVRPEFEVEVTRLGDGLAVFLRVLAAGENLGAAALEGASAAPGFDLAGALRLLISTGVASALHTPAEGMR